MAFCCPASFNCFLCPCIAHDTLKLAPGSTANFPTTTSPSIFAVDFNVSVPDKVSLPKKAPSK